MTPTRPSVLVALALLVGALTWLVVRQTYGSLPSLPVVGPVTLVVLAAGELVYAFSVRSRLRHPERGRLEPMFVAKLAVLAKASSHAGAIVAGLYGGFLLYTVQHLGKPKIGTDARVAALSLAASLALVGAALFLEFSCRVPRRPGDRDRDVAERR